MHYVSQWLTVWHTVACVGFGPNNNIRRFSQIWCNQNPTDQKYCCQKQGLSKTQNYLPPIWISPKRTEHQPHNKLPYPPIQFAVAIIRWHKSSHRITIIFWTYSKVTDYNQQSVWTLILKIDRSAVISHTMSVFYITGACKVNGV